MFLVLLNFELMILLHGWKEGQNSYLPGPIFSFPCFFEAVLILKVTVTWLFGRTGVYAPGPGFCPPNLDFYQLMKVDAVANSHTCFLLQNT